MQEKNQLSVSNYDERGLVVLKPGQQELLRKVEIYGEGQKELRLGHGDNPRIYYHVYLQKESSYIISESNFDRVMEAIKGGAKFVRINDDIINVNEIRRFKKNS